jgi:hypothetical protein
MRVFLALFAAWRRSLLEVRHGQPWSSAKAADDRLDQRLKELRVDGRDRNACTDPSAARPASASLPPAGVIFRSNDPIEVADEHRTSRQLEHWLEKVSAAIEREATSEQAPSRGDFPDYVRALQRIALGQDPTATARDRLAALEELLELGPKGTSSYLERPAQPELTEREHAIREAVQRRSLAQREREFGIG